MMGEIGENALGSGANRRSFLPSRPSFRESQ
jgi:hypothetical protein